MIMSKENNHNKLAYIYTNHSIEIHKQASNTIASKHTTRTKSVLFKFERVHLMSKHHQENIRGGNNARTLVTESTNHVNETSVSLLGSH